MDKYDKITNLQDKFYAMKKDTEMLLNSKEESIMELARSKFKYLLETLLQKVKEDPRGILKRLDDYVKRKYDFVEPPLSRAVIVKVF